jgi:hypothetical protein
VIEAESIVKSLLQSTVNGGVHHLEQTLFPIGVLSGLIVQPEQALYCAIAKGTAAYKWSEARGCDKGSKQ